MSKKHLQLALLFILVLVPVAALIHFTQGKPDLRGDFGEVKPFLAADTDGKPMTVKELRGAVTMMVGVPHACIAKGCAVTKTHLENWGHLVASESPSDQRDAVRGRLKLLVWTEDKTFYDNSARKDVVGVVEASFQDFLALLPDGVVKSVPTLDRPVVVLIDEQAKARYFAFADDVIDERTFDAWFAKLAITQRLNDYLSKRTFMGPRKEAATEDKSL